MRRHDIRHAKRGAGTSASALLTSPPFLIGVAVLALNDWVLKPAFGSWFTGKLSDVAGLFAFPILWTALAPRRRRLIYAFTALGFVLWKSPLSDAVIAAWNGLGVLSIGRTPDLTDWAALVALVPSYAFVRRRLERRLDDDCRRAHHPLRRAARVGSVAVAALVFTATTVMPRSSVFRFVPDPTSRADGAADRRRPSSADALAIVGRVAQRQGLDSAAYLGRDCTRAWATPPEAGHFRVALCEMTTMSGELQITLSQMPPGRRMGRKAVALRRELADSLAPYGQLISISER